MLYTSHPQHKETGSPNFSCVRKSFSWEQKKGESKSSRSVGEPFGHVNVEQKTGEISESFSTRWAELHVIKVIVKRSKPTSRCEEVCQAHDRLAQPQSRRWCNVRYAWGGKGEGNLDEETWEANIGAGDEEFSGVESVRSQASSREDAIRRKRLRECPPFEQF